jgi:hypothetical protein
MAFNRRSVSREARQRQPVCGPGRDLALQKKILPA